MKCVYWTCRAKAVDAGFCAVHSEWVRDFATGRMAQAHVAPIAATDRRGEPLPLRLIRRKHGLAKSLAMAQAAIVLYQVASGLASDCPAENRAAE